MDKVRVAPKNLQRDRRGLAEMLADELITSLIEDKLRPGSYLPPEPELGDRYGVSRGVVREATKILEARGLVEIHRGKGVAVRPIDSMPIVNALGIALQRHEASLMQVWQVRMILEVQGAAIAAGSATKEDLTRIAKTLESMRWPDRPLTHYVEADIAFHKEVVRSTKNVVLVLILDSLEPLLREGRKTTLSATGVHRALVGHERVYAAIRDKDPEGALSAMKEHLDWARTDLETAQGSPRH